MGELGKKNIATFGEVMMRLSPPGYAMFSQASNLELVYGGGEANVAISLAYFGLDATHVTRFPNNMIGKAATQFLRHHWIDTSHILFQGDTIGMYFLEKGAVHRPSEVLYERKNSSFAQIEKGTFDWEKILEGKDWFHWTGITPGISQGAADCCLEAIKAAKKLNIKVSADIHSRSNLWKYGVDKKEILPELISGCNIIFSSSSGLQELFDFSISEEESKFSQAACSLMKKYPSIEKVFDKKRETVSASRNRIQGKLWNGETYIKTEKFDVTHIVDRVGTGDAFAAGIIYGLLNYEDDTEALNFGTAACALKHTVEGDVNMVTVDNVKKLIDGSEVGRIVR